MQMQFADENRTHAYDDRTECECCVLTNKHFSCRVKHKMLHVHTEFRFESVSGRALQTEARRSGHECTCTQMHAMCARIHPRGHAASARASRTRWIQRRARVHYMWGSIPCARTPCRAHAHAHWRASVRVRRVQWRANVCDRQSTTAAHASLAHRRAPIQMRTLCGRVRSQRQHARAHAHCSHGRTGVHVQCVRAAIRPRQHVTETCDYCAPDRPRAHVSGVCAAVSIRQQYARTYEEYAQNVIQV
ncbi:unnamed protein product [Sphagnum balticum]